MKTLKEIAFSYLTEVLPARKIELLKQAETVLNGLEWQTYSKTKKTLGVTYYAGLNISSKIVKGEKVGFDTLILYLSASKNAGKDLCKFASTGCRLACLVESGRAIMSGRSKEKSIQVSRLIKSWLAIYRMDIAEKMLSHEIEKGKKKAKKNGNKFSVRLNGTSDLDFSGLIASFPSVQFYDYTKDPTRQQADNYHLTFSYSEMTQTRIKHYRKAIKAGINIAVPIASNDYKEALELPSVINGDDTDLRFLDGINGGFVALKAKITADNGHNKGMNEGFILNLEAFKALIEIVKA